MAKLKNEKKEEKPTKVKKDSVKKPKNQRIPHKYKTIVDKILAMDETMQGLSDEELKGKTKEFKERLEKGEKLKKLLPEAFAVVREADSRILDMKPFPVQLYGGIVLHKGDIAEMKTGEGKTLVATMPAYLNALTGKGVHIVTVNDYLAQRDAEWMGEVYRFLGLSVGCILNTSSATQRKEAYDCDITYITNSELGFDYLRDNMAVDPKFLVQRGLEYAIIDEVDSILIDESRTPLIISEASSQSTKLYRVCDKIARNMKRGKYDGKLTMDQILIGEDIQEDGDYLVNEKENRVQLTAQGVKKVEKALHIDNYADTKNIDIQRNMNLAIRAHALMKKDVDYIVRNGKVEIVDEFTGRVMPDRRFNDGLHQAIEAKEHVQIQRESATQATVTYQNFFNKYKKKCGMTGTAKTEEKEFKDIYKMSVISIPTNKPVIRKDALDSVYITKAEKYKCIVKDVVETHKTGQPILIGTTNIEVSELLSTYLKKEGIKHAVLNAKNHAKEARIVANAGKINSVTIATNMAGRGTDIKLEDGVAALGGLKIIGTERHESRRIDNQLIGRAGRQGDPGESKFYLSLEDDLLKRYGSEKMIKAYQMLNLEECEEIGNKRVVKTVRKAQKTIEGNHFNQRKSLLDYDKISNEQRELIYQERNKLLQEEDVSKVISGMFKRVAKEEAKQAKPTKRKESWNYDNMKKYFPFDPETMTGVKSEKQAAKKIQESIEMYYTDKVRSDFTEEELQSVERYVLLKTIDSNWKELLEEMDRLRDSIFLQGYAQKDPVVQYKLTGYELFEEMILRIKLQTVEQLMHVRHA